MSTRKHKITRSILVILIAVVLLCAALVLFLVGTARSDADWEAHILEKGPWGVKSIWVSEEGDLWIISEEREDIGQAAKCDVHVFMRSADGWDEVSMNTQKWDRTVRVGTYELTPPDVYPSAILRDEEIFTCRLSVKNGTMVLSKFTETGEREFVDGRERITLTRYDYADKIAQIPFDYSEK